MDPGLYFFINQGCLTVDNMNDKEEMDVVDVSIGVDLAGLLGGTHDERRRWVRAEWSGVWGGVSPLQPTKGSGRAL